MMLVRPAYKCCETHITKFKVKKNKIKNIKHEKTTKNVFTTASLPVGVLSVTISASLCLFICLFVFICLSVYALAYLIKPHVQISTNLIFVHVTCDFSSFFFWQQCFRFCTNLMVRKLLTVYIQLQLMKNYNQSTRVWHNSLWVKDKGFPYSLPSVGFGTDPGVQAVSGPQMIKVIHPAVGCHYFPPGLRLLSQPVPTYTAWWQRHIDVNNLPKVVTQLCPGEYADGTDRRTDARPLHYAFL